VSEPNNTHDLVVIGGGPAGIVAASAAARLGKRVSVIDRHPELGGAGINTGTVPSKTLRETALALSGYRSRDLHGVDLSLRRDATVAEFLHHEQDVKTSANVLLSQLLLASGIEAVTGLATFRDAHTVSVQSANGQEPASERSFSAPHILIATGSTPLRPPLYPFGANVYDSDSILELERVPKSLAVIGAGVIGCEYACIFAALGTTVHLIDGRDALLPFLDSELSTALMDAMVRTGVKFHWHERVTHCSSDERGVRLLLDSGEELALDAVLVAAGRSGNTAELGLAAAGLTPDAHGVLAVDADYRTSVPHILAAGDVIGPPALASTSMRQGRFAVERAFNPATHLAPLVLPYGVYTIPEVSMIGETEASLRQRGTAYLVGRARYATNARGSIMGDKHGFLKLLFEREQGKLVGVHVIGEQATELVHVGLMALLGGMTARVLSEVCFNTPTLGELYMSAALDALGLRPTLPDQH
jgi:NAD(P) transhydrogenase